MEPSNNFSKSSESKIPPGYRIFSSGTSDNKETLPKLFLSVNNSIGNEGLTHSLVANNSHLQIESEFLKDDPSTNTSDNTSNLSETVDNFPHDEKVKDESNIVHIPLPEQSGNKLSNTLLAESNISSFSVLNVSQKTTSTVNQEEILLPNQDELKEAIPKQTKNYIDNSKYSPSKLESDEESQEFSVASKPKLLGKEQAKKRLMAFSLTKQPNVTSKKTSKLITPAKNKKEKPPNPNKSSGIQEQFRATISAIEEEKKKMYKNMPNYLLLELNELTNSVLPPSYLTYEKEKNEQPFTSNKEADRDSSSRPNSSLQKREFNRKSSRRSLSRSKRIRSRSNSHSRRSRSRTSRSRRSRSRRSRSRSRSKRSRSRGRKRSRSRGPREDKNYKLDKKDSRSLKVKTSLEKKKITEGDCNKTKSNFEESSRRKDDYQKRSLSPNCQLDFKPIFNYLNKKNRIMKTLEARSVDSGSETSISYCEKTIKYTRTKPVIHWAENPSYATEFYMKKQMLLENCDPDTLPILNFIIENKSQMGEDKLPEHKLFKSRPWYPQHDYLMPILSINCENRSSDSPEFHKISCPGVSCDFEKQEQDKEKKFNANGNENNEENIENSESLGIKEINNERKKLKVSREKRISLVNDSYLSDEELDKNKVENIVLGDVKVQLNLESDSLKVRSKWDSDYENDNSEKELNSRQDEDMDIATSDEQTEGLPLRIKDKLNSENSNLQEKISKLESNFESKIKSVGLTDINEKKNSESLISLPSDSLVSEYEEFLKMVSFDFNSNQGESTQSKQDSKSEKQKDPRVEKLSEKCKFEGTDWDKESDHEEKLFAKKIDTKKNDSSEEFIASNQDKPYFRKKKNKKKILRKKKTEKQKSKKNKSLKKFRKGKKKNYRDSSTSDSSSDSCDTESDSDSIESKTSKKKKRKKKAAKAKKKSRRESSSESDSDSNKSSSKKKKAKKRRELQKKNNLSSDNDEEMQNALLKQLDFKKQLIMKKIEEIDSISERSGKKKELESKERKKNKDMEESELLDKILNRKKDTELKIGSDRKKSKNFSKKDKARGSNSKDSSRKSKTSSDSSDSSDCSTYELNKKKNERKKYDSSESSGESENTGRTIRSHIKSEKLADVKNMKLVGKTGKKYIKIKREGKKEYSSSDSGNDDHSSKEMMRKKEKLNLSDEQSLSKGEAKQKWMENLSRDNKLIWGENELKKKSKFGVRNNKEVGDWESNTSYEESEQGSKKRESSWDEDAPFSAVRTEANKSLTVKSEELGVEEKSNVAMPQKKDYEDLSKTVSHTASETLKTSLSNFSFNENSFCSFGQELSRDFFLTERGYFSSTTVGGNEHLTTTLVEPRPFQSVSNSTEIKKTQNSELYSPGYSDSEQSDIDSCTKTETINGNSNSNLCCDNKDVYDPLNCESEASIENVDVELSSIPLPCVSAILLPGEERLNTKNACSIEESSTTKSPLKNKPNLTFNLTEEGSKHPKLNSTSSDFIPLSALNSSTLNRLEVKQIPTIRPVINMRPQQKLISKAASVFQDESDEDESDTRDKRKITDFVQVGSTEISKAKPIENTKEPNKKEKFLESKVLEHTIEMKVDNESGRDRFKIEGEKGEEKERNRKRSTSPDKRDKFRSTILKSPSPSYQSKSKTSESKCSNSNKEKREIKSDCFEIEPFQSLSTLEDTIQPIPVLTGLGVSSCDQLSWDRSHLLGFTCTEYTDSTGATIDHSEAFDIYPDSSKFQNNNFDKEFNNYLVESNEKCISEKSKKDRRKTRSKSLSPKKKRRSKSPERRKSPRSRSPRRRSSSPKRKEKSPYSPRKRSPKRKSSPRRYRDSRSPDRRRKSRSRSPRKRRRSPRDVRRSRSLSPKRHRSPKKRANSPKKMDSPFREEGAFSPGISASPKKMTHFSHHSPSTVHNRIPVLGASISNTDIELSPSVVMKSPRFDSPMNFSQQPNDPNVTNSEINNSYYNLELTNGLEFSNYSEEIGNNNLITVKNHEIEKVNSPERLSLDQRIELELGVQLTSSSQSTNEQYQIQHFQEINPNNIQNSYNCDNNTNAENFYQNQSMTMSQDFSNNYFNGSLQQSSNYGSFHQYPNSQVIQSSAVQVGNIVEVVPTLQQPPPPPPPPPPGNAPQVMQVGNVLQVVPSQKVPLCPPITCASTQNYVPPTVTSPIPAVKTQKATAVVAPSSVVPSPNTETVNPLIKAIQLEKEKRRQEKEKRKAEREARRKARQLRREAKLMSVNEKLKKSVVDEGLMLGQEVEDDELLDSLDIPSPPIPVEIITVSSPSALPPAGKGILITAGFMPKPPSEKKEVKFADGVLPGEGTSTSGGEDIASPPPKPKLPKEKRYKKKKLKVKKKVKVQIIRQIIHNEDEEEDDLSPPPPPPGDPPPVFFSRFPFVGDAQFPGYQTQTTALTTVQFSSFQ